MKHTKHSLYSVHCTSPFDRVCFFKRPNSWKSRTCRMLHQPERGVRLIPAYHCTPSLLYISRSSQSDLSSTGFEVVALKCQRFFHGLPSPSWEELAIIAGKTACWDATSICQVLLLSTVGMHANAFLLKTRGKAAKNQALQCRPPNQNGALLVNSLESNLEAKEGSQEPRQCYRHDAAPVKAQTTAIQGTTIILLLCHVRFNEELP